MFVLYYRLTNHSLLEYSYYHNCKDLQNIWNISSYLFRKDVKWIENLALALISLGWGQSLFQDTHFNVQKKNWLMVLSFVLNKVLQSKKLLGYWHAAKKNGLKSILKFCRKKIITCFRVRTLPNCIIVLNFYIESWCFVSWFYS